MAGPRSRGALSKPSLSWFQGGLLGRVSATTPRDAVPHLTAHMGRVMRRKRGEGECRRSREAGPDPAVPRPGRGLRSGRGSPRSGCRQSLGAAGRAPRLSSFAVGVSVLVKEGTVCPGGLMSVVRGPTCGSGTDEWGWQSQLHKGRQLRLRVRPSLPPPIRGQGVEPPRAGRGANDSTAAPQLCLCPPLMLGLTTRAPIR